MDVQHPQFIKENNNAANLRLNSQIGAERAGQHSAATFEGQYKSGAVYGGLIGAITETEKAFKSLYENIGSGSMGIMGILSTAGFTVGGVASFAAGLSFLTTALKAAAPAITGVETAVVAGETALAGSTAAVTAGETALAAEGVVATGVLATVATTLSTVLGVLLTAYAFKRAEQGAVETYKELRVKAFGAYKNYDTNPESYKKEHPRDNGSVPAMELQKQVKDTSVENKDHIVDSIKEGANTVVEAILKTVVGDASADTHPASGLDKSTGQQFSEFGTHTSKKEFEAQQEQCHKNIKAAAENVAAEIDDKVDPNAEKFLPGTKANSKQNQAVMMNRLQKEMGLSKVQSAAVVGNFAHESAGFQSDINEGKPLVPGSRGGYGLAQWTGPRRKALENYALKQGKDVKDMETQYGFYKLESRTTHKKAFEALKQTNNLEQAVRVQNATYESGGDPRQVAAISSRLKAANVAINLGQQQPVEQQKVDVSKSMAYKPAVDHYANGDEFKRNPEAPVNPVGEQDPGSTNTNSNSMVLNQTINGSSDPKATADYAVDGVSKIWNARYQPSVIQ